MSSALAHDGSLVLITLFLPQHPYSRPGAPRSSPESWLLRQGGGEKGRQGKTELAALLESGAKETADLPKKEKAAGISIEIGFLL